MEMKKHNNDEAHKVQRAIQKREIEERLSRIANKIVVMSGKGGVGKSSVAAYLSATLAKRGYQVGLMDVDLHGPSIPRMLGLKGSVHPGIQKGKATPVDYLPTMKVISIESLTGENKDAAMIWRGPLKIGVIKQFIADIEWGDLDYLIIDAPPGTGDEPLTVAQTIPDAEALIVTTPQEIALADVRKSINFCRQVNMEILGIVENMSGLTCPYCGKTIDLFKTQGGRATAKKEKLRLLSTLPFEPELVKNGDIGDISIIDNSQLNITRAINKMVDKILELHKAKSGPRLKLVEKEALLQKKGDGDSKVLAIPLSGGNLASHFGHCEQFAFVVIKDGKIKSSEMRMPPPHEPGVLPRWLSEQGANVAIVSGMGEKAQALLRDQGIEVIIGASIDSPGSLSKQYLAGTLVTGDNICDH